MAPENYLRGLLADGVQSFRFRVGVRELLGAPNDTGVGISFASVVPGGTFPYVKPYGITEPYLISEPLATAPHWLDLDMDAPLEPTASETLGSWPSAGDSPGDSADAWTDLVVPGGGSPDRTGGHLLPMTNPLAPSVPDPDVPRSDTTERPTRRDREDAPPGPSGRQPQAPTAVRGLSRDAGDAPVADARDRAVASPDSEGTPPPTPDLHRLRDAVPGLRSSGPPPNPVATGEIPTDIAGPAEHGPAPGGRPSIVPARTPVVTSLAPATQTPASEFRPATGDRPAQLPSTPDVDRPAHAPAPAGWRQTTHRHIADDDAPWEVETARPPTVRTAHAPPDAEPVPPSVGPTATSSPTPEVVVVWQPAPAVASTPAFWERRHLGRFRARVLR